MSSQEKKTVTWKDLDIIKDREQDVRAFCARLLDYWGYDLQKRKPGVAFVDEEGIPVTDLDLAAFLSTLVENRTVINMKTYKSRRAATKREGEFITSKDNRHGRLSGLTSKKDSFSFGIRFDDLNVMQVKKSENGEVVDTDIGAPRAMILQDVTGEWYEGWDTIHILPTGLSKEVFEQLSGAAQKLKFQYFIHPMRWTSFYGKYYVIAKAAILRLEDEIRFVKAEVKRLQEELSIPPTEWPKSEKVGEEKKIKVWAFEAALDGFELKNDYAPFPSTKDGFNSATMMKTRLNNLIEQLRFLVRATEFSFWQNAVLKNIPEESVLNFLKEGNGVQPRLPSWVVQAGVKWNTGWKETEKAKNCWATIKIAETGMQLRWRAWQKTEAVAAD